MKKITLFDYNRIYRNVRKIFISELNENDIIHIDNYIYNKDCIYILLVNDNIKEISISNNVVFNKLNNNTYDN